MHTATCPFSIVLCCVFLVCRCRCANAGSLCARACALHAPPASLPDDKKVAWSRKTPTPERLSFTSPLSNQDARVVRRYTRIAQMCTHILPPLCGSNETASSKRRATQNLVKILGTHVQQEACNQAHLLTPAICRTCIHIASPRNLPLPSCRTTHSAHNTLSRTEPAPDKPRRSRPYSRRAPHRQTQRLRSRGPDKEAHVTSLSAFDKQLASRVRVAAFQHHCHNGV
jgi:hypothetical protein